MNESEATPPPAPDSAAPADPFAKKKGEAKTGVVFRKFPVEVVAARQARADLRKPDWIRVKAGSPSTRFYEIKNILREHRLHTVCEEASCPNIGECFGKGTATFMIMGDKCTRRCTFCDVAHGRPQPLDADEPLNLARTIAALKLDYVVITSVDRDDLKDGGAQHFVDCIDAVREMSPRTRIEVLVPDFRGRLERALEILQRSPPDVMNHNLETVPRLYRMARPGSDYTHSLQLLQQFKRRVPHVPTKSGVMLGLGEEDDEVIGVMRDLRAHDVDMVTIGQYLAPSNAHFPVQRYVHPDAFARFERDGLAMGFSNVASGALVRSSYYADQQAHQAGVV
jgi:lipoic acid synthetase